MDESILKVLNRAGFFTENDSLSLRQELQFKKLKKGEFLLKNGDVCSSLWFVASGCFYHYGLSSELDKNIIDLSVENDWVVNHKSFTSRKPSTYYIQAFEDSTIYEITIDSIHSLISQSQSFLQLGKILEESTSRINFFDNNSTPDEKYLHILEDRPLILQKFPLTIIASYLKITPETLSRVRKRLL